VTSVRDGSPGEKAGIQVREVNKKEKVEGDIINELEVANPDGKGITRWVVTRSKQVPANVTEKDLDPVRLPYELEQWAKDNQWPADKKSSRKVKLTVLRKVGHQAAAPVKLEAPWEDGWELSNAIPLEWSSPMAIPGLGIAYRVENTIEAVKDGSPATRGRRLNDKGEATDEPFKLQKGDVIKGVRFLRSGVKVVDAPKPGSWADLEKYAKKVDRPEFDHWAYFFDFLQHNADVKEMDLRVERGNEKFEVRLIAEPADGQDGRELWPIDDRGLNLIRGDKRIQIAADPLDALRMGVVRTKRFIVQIYMQLRSIISGRVSVENLGGPILIAQTAYHVADYDLFRFVLFLGMISVNLAVINFLPIPVLDGGHMVFLIYEKLRGKPASEQVRNYATLVGLGLIGCLMVFVFYLDIKRQLPGH